MDDTPTILIVDDTPANIAIINTVLKRHYRTRIGTDGAKALELAHGTPSPDLILLDIMMPGMDGYEVCGKLKADPATAEIPIIFLTAMSEVSDETHGFEVGAVDYITKPFTPAVVEARVRTHLALTRAQHALKDQNRLLEERVAERTRELGMVQDATILAMASLAETRDNETGNHIRRTQHYVKALAEELAKDPRFAPALPPEEITRLYKSAPLHDIGKVGIPDSILLKPGPLTAEEFEIMKTHTTLGRDAIATAEAQLGNTTSSFLRLAREIAHTHQEKWDGTGYPQGLKGTDIPLSGRLMALADVYDALISRRVYKPPFPHGKAVEIITEGRGRHFDPDLVDAFLRIEGHFARIAARFSDEPDEVADVMADKA
ncbi:HD-GYP domain-containing protein [Roseospirillum parvum]|uniref:Putative two-component system response regulator n=1 Tax=Roseospirillum parvum TaxID=83401 RepID=A0A1G7V9Y6_9PROT|nr:two-component system response regulator [Roseospirillum parvum]SDG56149.1 putative two-component system response regulator [Roseospirillum parvum]